MIRLRLHQEYSARFGLKNALHDIEIAQQIAEAKYRSLVGRDIFYKEMVDIHALIVELRDWAANESSSQKMFAH
ncbi:MAG: hypothetical protein ABW044_12535 [Cellvibrio sp.]